MQRRHHYERAFEDYLRSRRIPYVSVNEARKTLLPHAPHGQTDGDLAALKSFDFVVYGQGTNLLVDIKGRRLSTRAGRSELAAGSMQTWVTEDDISSLRRWQQLFGPGFDPVFIFIYLCDAQPPDALFQEVLRVRDQWYTLRCIHLEDYARAMKPRSARWRTVHLSASDFQRLSHPFAPPSPSGGTGGSSASAPGGLFSPDLGPEIPAILPLGR